MEMNSLIKVLSLATYSLLLIVAVAMIQQVQAEAQDEAQDEFWARIVGARNAEETRKMNPENLMAEKLRVKLRDTAVICNLMTPKTPLWKSMRPESCESCCSKLGYHESFQWGSTCRCIGDRDE